MEDDKTPGQFSSVAAAFGELNATLDSMAPPNQDHVARGHAVCARSAAARNGCSNSMSDRAFSAAIAAGSAAETEPDGVGAARLSLETCLEILGRECGLSDEEVIALRNAVYGFAEVALEESRVAQRGPLDHHN